jgi:hypothetical protein
MAGVLGLIWGAEEADSFLEQDWTGQIALKGLRKLVSARTPVFARRARLFHYPHFP